MQSPSQSPKKNRLLTFNQTFDSAINETSEKFVLDKTLAKGIKNNDPSKIVQNGEEADLGNLDEIYNEEKQIAGILIGTRKKYDETRLTTNRLQEAIQKLRKQKEILESQTAKWNADLSEQEKTFHNIQQQLAQMNQMYDSVKYARDCRLSMGDTLRKDILFYKKNCFQANIKIVRNHNKLKSLTGQFQSSKRLSSTCKSMIGTIDRKVNVKQSERYDKINSIHQVLNKKMQNSQLKQQRSDRINTSMVDAMNSRMPEEMEQMKLLGVNLMVKKMLKMNMLRVMQQYSDTEVMFRTIKQHSTVKTAEEFVSRFMARQKIYGELLQSISRSEQKILELKDEREELLKDNVKAEYERSLIEEEENQKNQHLTKTERKNMDLMREQLLKNENQKNKTYSWSTKFISTFDNKKISHVKRNVQRDKISQVLLESLKRMLQFVEQLNQKANNSVSKEEADSKMDEIYVEAKYLEIPAKFKVKNARIKTMSTRDDNNNVNQAFEDHDVAYDDYSEKDYLNQNRRQIKKANYFRNRIKTKAM